MILYFNGFFAACNQSNDNPRSKKMVACIPVVNAIEVVRFGKVLYITLEIGTSISAMATLRAKMVEDCIFLLRCCLNRKMICKQLSVTAVTARMGTTVIS